MYASYGTTSIEQHNGDENRFKHEPPPFLTKLSYASYLYFLKGLATPLYRFLDLRESFCPRVGAPDIVKSYECRPDLPVR